MLAAMRLLPVCLATLIASMAGCANDMPIHAATPTETEVHARPARVLVFSRSAGFRHDAIPVTIETLHALGAGTGLEVVASEDPTQFTDMGLADYRAVVFAHTTQEVLDEAQRAAFERYVAAGGSFMGIHAAADRGYTWPWYGDLVGAWFARHPEGLQTVRVVFEGGPGPMQRDDWTVTDEIYDYHRNPRADVQVIASVDTASHPTGQMGNDHPIAWCHIKAGGRAWYTGLGHDRSLYADPVFRAHLLRGLRYVTLQSSDC